VKLIPVSSHGPMRITISDGSPSITLADLEGYLAESYADSTRALVYDTVFCVHPIYPHHDPCLQPRIAVTHRVPTLEGFAQYLRRKQ
jgi:hypothetical protein